MRESGERGRKAAANAPKARGRAWLGRGAAELPRRGSGAPAGRVFRLGSENQLRKLAAAGRTVLFRGWAGAGEALGPVAARGVQPGCVGSQGHPGPLSNDLP